jgi:undecaprenyl-diphosphatase
MRSLIAIYRRSFAARAVVGFVSASLLLAVLGLFTTNSHLVVPYFDEHIRSYVQSLASPSLTAAMRVLTRLGSTVGLTAIGAVVIAIFLYMRKLRYIGLMLLVMAGQGLLQYSFKSIIGRERPQAMFDYVIGDTPSFPSGHSLAAVCFFGLLAYLLSREVSNKYSRAAIWTIAVTVIIAVGFSRIYFDVHYPSDVLAGYLAGLMWAGSVATGTRS